MQPHSPAEKRVWIQPNHWCFRSVVRFVGLSSQCHPQACPLAEAIAFMEREGGIADKRGLQTPNHCLPRSRDSRGVDNHDVRSMHRSCKFNVVALLKFSDTLDFRWKQSLFFFWTVLQFKAIGSLSSFNRQACMRFKGLFRKFIFNQNPCGYRDLISIKQDLKI